jgi:hypothetical protein
MPPESEDRQQHRMLQKEFGSFYCTVSDILFRHNPMELDGKHNTGDYNPVWSENRIRVHPGNFRLAYGSR